MEHLIRKLFSACRLGENETLKEILAQLQAENYKQNLEQTKAKLATDENILSAIFKYKSYEGYNLLMLLVHHRKKEFVKFVLENFSSYLDFDATTGNEFTHNCTVLHIACDSSVFPPDKVTVEDLVQAYSQKHKLQWMRKPDSLGRTALMLSVSARDQGIFHFLHGHGLELEEQDKNKRTILHYLFDDPISLNFETTLSESQKKILATIIITLKAKAENVSKNKMNQFGLENLLETLCSGSNSKLTRSSFGELVGPKKIGEIEELLKQHKK